MDNQSPTYELDFKQGKLDIELQDGSALKIGFRYEPTKLKYFSTTNEVLYPLEIVAEKDGKAARIRRDTDYGAGYPVNFYLFDRGLGKPVLDDRLIVAQMMKEAQRGRPSLRDYVENAVKSFAADVRQSVGQEHRVRKKLSGLRTHLSGGVTEREYLRMLAGMFESDEMRGLIAGHVADSLETKIGDLTKKVKPLGTYQTEFEVQLVDIATAMVRDEDVRKSMKKHLGENTPLTRNAMTNHQGLALFYVMENLFNRNAHLITSLEAVSLERGRMMTPEEHRECIRVNF
ncbi:hypothetical protein HYX03_03330 [Candidatus Woesearchaeota archaeon]|nr:hypothetical protein [Candidatus Woesearchaeota archaeon]